MKYTLDWAAVDIDGSNTLSNGADSIGVTISTPENAEHNPKQWTVGFGEGDPNTIEGDQNTIRSSDVREPTELKVDFDREVTDLEFELYDVDAGKSWDDQVKIIAKDADGNDVEVQFDDLIATHDLDGNTIEGEGNADPNVNGPGAPDSVTITIPGPVQSVCFVHQDGADKDISGTVGLSDWHFEAGPMRDGIVHGTAGDDVIVEGGYVDDDGDEIDNEDALIPGDAPNDDRVVAKEGDDEVRADDGDDTVEGGEGSDTLGGGSGDDVIYGNEKDGGEGIIDDGAFPSPAPDPMPEDDRDELRGGAGDDKLFGQDDRDTLIGGSGDDTLDGGIDDDQITGGSGSDSAIGGQGDDEIDAGVSSVEDRPDLGYPGLFPADADPTNDLDFVDGGLGDDTISTGDDDDTIFGGEGDDEIDAGFDRDEIDGGAGNDRIVAGEGSDTVAGGDGDDTIFGGIGDPADPINILDDGTAPPAPDLVTDNGRDELSGGAGDDLIFGEDDDDTLYGGDGNDTLDAGIDDDLVRGGAGDDLITGGQGKDALSGGDDADTFVLTGAENDAGDTIAGGSGGNDIDRFDVTALGERGVDWDVENLVPDGDPEPFAGFDGDLVFLDGMGNETGRTSFTNIEIICFTPGTRIATPKGEMPVETLTAGDEVLTRDNGIREIAWYGQTGLNAADFVARPHLAPVLITEGSLGNGLPERDMLVSPQHRVLVCSDRAAYYFDEREVLVAAKHLVNGTTIRRQLVPQTTYIHFMCEAHEVVLSDGAWTESFQPGDFSLSSMDRELKNEIFELFPELATEDGLRDYAAARRTLKRHEAVLLSA